MEVKLLFSPSHYEALDILYSACRQCYYSGCVGDEYPFSNVPYNKKKELIERIIQSGHHSVLEHVSFTFSIKNLSRVAQQQLTRHRIGVSYSIQSMRYCDIGQMDLQIPSSINNNADACTDYCEIANSAVEFYRKYTTDKDFSIPREDARSVLPLGWNSNIVMTMNCRELLHFFNERLCINAQREIRHLAKQMLRICKENLPEVFSAAGPKCSVLGYCNEGKRSCHMYPLKEEIFNVYNKFKDSVENE